MKKIVCLFCILCIGCEGSIYGMVVDENCTDGQIMAIQEGMDKFNSVVGEEAFVIDSVESIDYDGKFDYMIICAPDIERWPSLANVVGRMTGTNIFLRTDLGLSDKEVMSITMHEMIHLIGAENKDHSTNQADVFYKKLSVDPVVDYGDYDINIINLYY